MLCLEQKKTKWVVADGEGGWVRSMLWLLLHIPDQVPPHAPILPRMQVNGVWGHLLSMCDLADDRDAYRRCTSDENGMACIRAF
jgi:hypothetical protein